MRSDCNHTAFFNPTAAESIRSFVPESYIRDHLNSVFLQPMTYGSAAIDIPQLHDKRHVSVQTEIRQDYAVEFPQPADILSGISP